MKCDIIIPIWNQHDYTKACIESIFKNTLIPFRLILVDNASDVPTKSLLEDTGRAHPDRVTVIRNEKNLGFVVAVNQGLRISDSPYICILNNDTVAAPNWLTRMIAFSQRHPDIGLINPQANGHGERSIEEYAKLLEKNEDIYMEMNQCQGYCMLMTRDLFLKIGYLDEAFEIGGYDDTDYSMRAHVAGYRCACVYDAYVYHRLHASFDKAGNREELVQKNMKVYYEKWGKHLRAGLAISLDKPDDDKMAALVALFYGLAREWAWVHAWINYRGDHKILEKKIEDHRKKAGLPLHQNLRYDYFSLPEVIFSTVVAGKVIERLRRRMKDKRYDAIIKIGDKVSRPLSFASRITGAKIFDMDLAKTAAWPKETGKSIVQKIKYINGANAK